MKTQKTTVSQTVLVVDDDPGILEVIKIILSEHGYTVIAVSEASLVKEAISQNSPNIILMDLWMSGIDGHEITKYLKGNQKLKSIPIVIISALSEGEKMAMEAGADDFLAKPFNIEDLIEVVQKHL